MFSLRIQINIISLDSRYFISKRLITLKVAISCSYEREINRPVYFKSLRSFLPFAPSYYTKYISESSFFSIRDEKSLPKQEAMAPSGNMWSSLLESLVLFSTQSNQFHWQVQSVQQGVSQCMNRNTSS